MKISSRIKALFTAFVLCFTLSGCSPFTTDADSLLTAPKLTGELRPVQEALDKSIGGNYSLKFPASGETKSAITIANLDADDNNEAVAFYSTSEDNTVTMHIAVLDSTDGVWKRASKAKIVAGDVERVHFADMDGDGIKEIIVGWNVYGEVEKAVSVYEYNGSELITIIEEPYTTFLLCDLDGGFSSDLLTVYLDLSSGSATAKYFDVTERGVVQLGSCDLDGNVTAYYEPVLVKLSDDSYCVYLDCVKGSGLVTEILFVKDGNLVAPFFDPITLSTDITYRQEPVPCRDFDGDSSLEIPIMTALPTDTNQSASAAYLTVWHSFKGGELVPESYTLMNYSDGYSLNLTKKLAEITTTVRNLENRERIIYSYDYEKSEFKDEIFRIRVVSQTSYDSGMYADSYTVLSQKDAQVWLLKISEYAGNYGINEQKVKEMFALITNE